MSKKGRTKVMVDPAPDAYGSWTIRFDDGTLHGDTDTQPIATVYDKDDAKLIVSALNNTKIVPFLHSL